MRTTFVHQLEQVPFLEPNAARPLSETANVFPFLSNDYYLSLIDWNDPADPLRRLIIPAPEETAEWGREDASNEKNYTILPGVQHKYPTTALLLVNDRCAGLCRYCFRKRIFSTSRHEVLTDLPAAAGYIREHREITNVLLTGGDPFMLPTPELDRILERIAPIEHVRIIRIGTKIPAFNPYRILDDPYLPQMIERHSSEKTRIYIMTHFDHPREITPVAVRALERLQKAGAILTNQNPLIRGVNDHPKTLATLFRSLSFVGVPPYYIFQCRPVWGNKAYAVPIEQGYTLIEQARSMVSGLAKRARFVMSHASGKIEILGMTAQQTFFKYFRAANDADSGRFMVFKSNPGAYWFDDYAEVIGNYPVDQPYRLYGPE
jgi:KamA family protein